ncbi:hypothetical protein Ddc_18413 [Ditylenchus destructor]|nr:hypothetical protein Ddc_18413 [Ditylenchus destructor]
MDVTTGIDVLPDVNLAQILGKLPWRERLKSEQVCKKWQNVGKNCSWSNYRIFDHETIEQFFASAGDDQHQLEKLKVNPFFERCGRYLRHMTLRCSLPQTALTFLEMAPNVQHLRYWPFVYPEPMVELAKVFTRLNLLKSLDLKLVPLMCNEAAIKTDFGLMESFKAMSRLEYLHINDVTYLFDQQSFVQFPPNLKYFTLIRASSGDKILSWVAEGCKHLKGLSVTGTINENAFKIISRMKSLTYLCVLANSIPCDIGYIFKGLTELRALEIKTVDSKVIKTIAQYCQKLEHLSIMSTDENVSSETQDNILCLASLKNLCSLIIRPRNYSKDQATELVNRFIDNGNLQYIGITISKGSLEPEVLFEILRRCKGIQCISLGYEGINSDFYAKICQVVDEVDEIGRQQCEFTKGIHPIVEIECDDFYAKQKMEPYKWIRFTYVTIKTMSLPAVCEKWQYGSLSAGKPEWTSRNPMCSLDK